MQYHLHIYISGMPEHKCGDCGGSGKTGSGWMDDDIHECYKCHGSGKITDESPPIPADMIKHMTNAWNRYWKKKDKNTATK